MTICDIVTVNSCGSPVGLLSWSMRRFSLLEQIKMECAAVQPALVPGCQAPFSGRCLGLDVQLIDTCGPMRFRDKVQQTLGAAHHSAEYGFHITLAYEHERADPGLQQELKVKVAKILAGKTIQLEPARLVYFEDMTDFVPL